MRAVRAARLGKVVIDADANLVRTVAPQCRLHEGPCFGILGRIMNPLRVSGLILATSISLIAFGCSNETERRPAVGAMNTGGASAALGGRANSGGSGGSTTGVGGSATGAVSAVGGSGGTSSGGTASGGGLNLDNCDTATLANLFNVRHCDDCHFANISFHIPASLEGWVGTEGKKAMTENCPTRTVVVPKSPETSLLYIKLAGTPPEKCGEQMPLPARNKAFVPFTADELKCVADWINSLPAAGTGGAGGAGGQAGAQSSE